MNRNMFTIVALLATLGVTIVTLLAAHPASAQTQPAAGTLNVEIARVGDTVWHKEIVAAGPEDIINFRLGYINTGSDTQNVRVGLKVPSQPVTDPGWSTIPFTGFAGCENSEQLSDTAILRSLGQTMVLRFVEARLYRASGESSIGQEVVGGSGCEVNDVAPGTAGMFYVVVKLRYVPTGTTKLNTELRELGSGTWRKDIANPASSILVAKVECTNPTNADWRLNIKTGLPVSWSPARDWAAIPVMTTVLSNGCEADCDQTIVRVFNRATKLTYVADSTRIAGGVIVGGSIAGGSGLTVSLRPDAKVTITFCVKLATPTPMWAVRNELTGDGQCRMFFVEVNGRESDLAGVGLNADIFGRDSQLRLTLSGNFDQRRRFEAAGAGWKILPERTALWRSTTGRWERAVFDGINPVSVGSIPAGTRVTIRFTLKLPTVTPRFNYRERDYEQDRGANTSAGNTVYCDPVSARVGDTVTGIVYYSNGATGSVAVDTHVRLIGPATINGRVMVASWVWAVNAFAVGDTIVNGQCVGPSALTIYTEETTAHGEFVPGSVRWWPAAAIYAGSGPMPLPGWQTGDELFTPEGVNLGNIPGDEPGVWCEGTGFVTYQVRIVGDTSP